MSMACIETADSPSQVPIQVAVIVPTYKQPGLLAEALDTALRQRCDFGYSIIVVEDGCPFPETAQVCRDFAAAHPGRIHHLRKRNNGLSAARNTGIEFALAAFPGLEAVYFLDSDNRIQPLLLQRLFDALRRSGPEIGWAYPDIDKFGFPEFCDTSGDYSPLEHLFRNVSEAGSMASRRLLDAGARFDETMRKGWEDWEFWLQGLELGFRGVHVPFAGFRYRRRGESMLTNAERDMAALHAALHCRHPGLYGVKAIARLEAEASRRYAVYLTDLGIVRCLNGGGRHDDAEDLTEDEFAHRALRLFERPGYGSCPGQVIVMDSALFALLASRRLLDGVLWTLERAMMRATVVTCAVDMGRGSFLDENEGMEWQVRSTPSSGAPAAPLVEAGAGSGGDGHRRPPDADTARSGASAASRHAGIPARTGQAPPPDPVRPDAALAGPGGLTPVRHQGAVGPAPRTGGTVVAGGIPRLDRRPGRSLPRARRHAPRCLPGCPCAALDPPGGGSGRGQDRGAGGRSRRIGAGRASRAAVRRMAPAAGVAHRSGGARQWAAGLARRCGRRERSSTGLFQFR